MTLYAKVGLHPIVNRDYDLAMKYLTKAVTSNNIANETVNTYLRIGIKDDGAYWKRNNRPTLLGLIKRKALAIRQNHNSNK